ncbi:MAG: 2-polyprenyl-6-methoxyphenol hydroxylase-like oxidoreductase, partial [Mycobacterium sp.]|nr:2-polyprenyl-6-methoxyphenol hydroxylase-like oxidoreductase [Mycobacterium sp.]
MASHAVISGTGIGAPALARQLAARGWRTTVIERYPQRRDEGQNVDIRGAAREVVRRMGIDADVRAADTTEVGMRLPREDGSTAAAFPISPGTDGSTAELEILRGELSRILIERSDSTEYFGAQITDVSDRDDHVLPSPWTTAAPSMPTCSCSPRACTPRILAELEAGAPMYFSSVGQMSTPTWSKGRMILLGDAAHCNATFGGAFTSLALIGAYILAGELGMGSDIASALPRYQQRMKPFVDAAPLVRPRILRLANPRTRAGIRVLRTLSGRHRGGLGGGSAADQSRCRGTVAAHLSLAGQAGHQQREQVLERGVTVRGLPDADLLDGDDTVDGAPGYLRRFDRIRLRRRLSHGFDQGGQGFEHRPAGCGHHRGLVLQRAARTEDQRVASRMAQGEVPVAAAGCAETIGRI